MYVKAIMYKDDILTTSSPIWIRLSPQQLQHLKDIETMNKAYVTIPMAKHHGRMLNRIMLPEVWEQLTVAEFQAMKEHLDFAFKDEVNDFRALIEA